MKLTQHEKILDTFEHPERVPQEYVKSDATGVWVSARYLKRILWITECNGRISELRAKGHEIKTHHEKDEHGFAYHRLIPPTQLFTLSKPPATPFEYR